MHWRTFPWRKAGDLAQSGPVAVGAYQGPGLGAGSAKLTAKWSGQRPSGPPPHWPLSVWKALPIFLATLQPSGRRGLAASSEGPSPCPPGTGDKSGLVSPLGAQPTQLFPAAPPCASAQPVSHKTNPLLPDCVAPGFCLWLVRGQDLLLPSISLRADVPVAHPSLPNTLLCYSQSRQPLSADRLWDREASRGNCLMHSWCLWANQCGHLHLDHRGVPSSCSNPPTPQVRGWAGRHKRELSACIHPPIWGS